MENKTKPENPPAFASDRQGGMTLRDYFAAMAMQGLLSRGSNDFYDIPEIAYKIADAMLEERSGVNGKQ